MTMVGGLSGLGFRVVASVGLRAHGVQPELRSLSLHIHCCLGRVIALSVHWALVMGNPLSAARCCGLYWHRAWAAHGAKSPSVFRAASLGGWLAEHVCPMSVVKATNSPLVEGHHTSHRAMRQVCWCCLRCSLPDCSVSPLARVKHALTFASRGARGSTRLSHAISVQPHLAPLPTGALS